MHTSEHLLKYSDSIITFNRFLADKNFQGDRDSLSARLRELCSNLLEKWSADNNSTAVWINNQFFDLVNIIFITAADKDHNRTVSIGIHEQGIYLEMLILHEENIIKMPDEFWRLWLQLGTLGLLKLSGGEEFDTEDEKTHSLLFNDNTSTVYQVMRKAIAAPAITGFTMHPGNMSVTWLFDHFTIAEVAELGSKAFSVMYTLNNMLSK